MDTMSRECNLLVRALVKVKKSELVAYKDGRNEHRKYGYATINSFLKSVSGILSDNDIILTQVLREGNPDPVLQTLLLHESGQWIKSEIPLIGASNKGSQDIGSQLTYMRKYSICAILGVQTEDETDDDGTKAQESYEKAKETRNDHKKCITDIEAKQMHGKIADDPTYLHWLLEKISIKQNETVTSLNQLWISNANDVTKMIENRLKVKRG